MGLIFSNRSLSTEPGRKTSLSRSNYGHWTRGKLCESFQRHGSPKHSSSACVDPFLFPGVRDVAAAKEANYCLHRSATTYILPLPTGCICAGFPNHAELDRSHPIFRLEALPPLVATSSIQAPVTEHLLFSTLRSTDLKLLSTHVNLRRMSNRHQRPSQSRRARP